MLRSSSRWIAVLVVISFISMSFLSSAHAAYYYAANGKKYASSLIEACLLQHDYSGVYPMLVSTRLWYSSAGLPNMLECAWKTSPGSLFWDFSYGSVECNAGEVADARAPNGCIKTDEAPAPVCTNVGNPVNALTGSKIQEVVDFSTSGSRSLQFVRYYNSSSGGISRVGPGWASNFDRQFDRDTTTTPNLIHITRPNGMVARFKRVSGSYVPTYWSGSGWATPRPDVSWTLEIEGAGYKFTDESKSVEHYNSAAKLTSIDYLGGYSIDLTYDSSGNNTTVTDNLGRTLAFTYTSGGLLDTMTDPAGHVYKYIYAYTGHAHPATTNLDVTKSQGLVLTKVLYPDSTPLVSTDNPFVLYHYDLPDQPYVLTGITDENGDRYATWTYNTDGRATSSSHAGDVDSYTIGYDDANNVQTVTNPLGKQAKYHYAVANGHRRLTSIEGIVSANCPASNSSFSYDANGYLSQVTDEEGRVTTIVNNASGLVTSKTEATGKPEARTTNTTWDTSLRKPTAIEASRLRIEFTYDGSGRVTQRKEIDETSHSLPYSTNGQTRTWDYTYTTAGLLDTIDGPLAGSSDSVSYAYDSRGFVSQITDALGHVTSVTSTRDDGLPLSVTDPNGVITEIAYNERGWLGSVTVNPGANQAVTTITYDNVGQVTKIVDPGGTYVQFIYNAARRLIGATNSAGERIDYTYDVMGAVSYVEIKSAGATTRFVRSFSHDELGRLMKIIGADAGETHIGYDKVGNNVSLETPRNKIYARAFDALNRLVSEVDPSSNATVFEHDAADNLSGVTDARSNQTAYIFDAWGDVLRTTNPDSGVTDYEYDAAGNMTKRTDARGLVTNFTYDSAGRILSKSFPAASSENVAYQYDATAGGNFGVGRLTSFTDGSGSSAFIYDVFGRIVSDTRVIGGNSHSIAYSYDGAGRILTLTYPSGRIVTYTRDALGKISAVSTKSDATSTSVDVMTGADYLPFGPLAGLTFGNGTLVSLSHDQDYRLTAINSNHGGTFIQDLVYSYDLAGNITSIADGLSTGRSQTFGYDDVDRLTSAAGLYGSTTYAYDAVGNRTGEVNGSTSLSSTYATTSNRLLSVSDGSHARTFAHLNSGQISEDERMPTSDYTYAYNNSGRLADVGLNGVSIASYLYNAFEQRVQKDAGGGVTQFVFDQAGHLLEEADGSGAAIREYLWLDDMPIALVDHTGASPEIYYIHVDHLGRPQKMTDASGSIVWDGVFDPFGKVASISGAATNLLMFPGQYHDSETQLSQNWHRDYDPSLGRYVESDPIGLEGGINTYAYVGGNPMRRVDPEGLEGMVVPGGPLPLIIPPAAFPGTKEKQDTSKLIMKALEIYQNYLFRGVPLKSDKECNEDRDQGCDKQYYDIDIPTCRGVSRQRGPTAGRRCYASAAQRYAACLKGQPMPPLDSWNN